MVYNKFILYIKCHIYIYISLYDIILHLMGNVMKLFYIVTNQTKDPQRLYTRKIYDYLLSKGLKCGYYENNSGQTDKKQRYTNADMIPEDVECIIVLGGDGTLIQAARDLNRRNIPLLGVNIGTLGYLTDTDMNNVFDTLDKVIADSYEIDSRMMLEGHVYRGDELIYEDTALNDVVVNRCGTLRIIDFAIYVNGTFLNTFSADGVIISTATGSTAYSLSAGGPIIQPNASLIMVTPVCPHTLNQRSIIFSPEDEVTIVMKDNKNLSEERVATFDGEAFCNVVTNDKIVIKRSDKVSRFIKTSNVSFLERIRNKM